MPSNNNSIPAPEVLVLSRSRIVLSLFLDGLRKTTCAHIGLFCPDRNRERECSSKKIKKTKNVLSGNRVGGIL